MKSATRVVFSRLAPLIVFSLTLLPSQASQPSLRGRITDASGAAVSNAIVTVSNREGFVDCATTNVEGVYEFRDMKAAIYSLRVTSPGFAVYEGRIASVGRAHAGDVRLVGADKQIVSVSELIRQHHGM